MVALNVAGAAPVLAEPTVRTIDTADLRWALRSGWDDFRAKRGDLLFVPLLYPLIGLVAAVAALEDAFLPLLFPLVAGLSILGPVAAAGFYEIAHRREAGDESGWSHFLDPLRPDRRAGFITIVGMLVALFVAWLLVAALIYQLTLGRLDPVGVRAFVTDLFSTREGWLLIVFGNAAGAAIAAATLVLTVVAVPMTVDRPVGAALAVRTSLRAAAANPGAIARWGLIVAALLAIGCVPLFIGLAVVLPVLGYATWHLYTRLVER